jgi:MFS family permease
MEPDPSFSAGPQPVDPGRKGSDMSRASTGAAPPAVLTVGLLLAASSVAFEAFAVNTAMPAAARELGGVADYGLVFSGFMLASFLGVVVGGAAADSGRAVVAFAAAAAAFGAGLLWAGSAADVLGIVQGRVMQGLGGGAANGLIYYAVRRAYDTRARPRMLSLLATAWVVPGLAGPAVSGLVAEHLSWRWVFWGLSAVLPAAAVLVIPSLRALPPVRPPDARRGRAVHWIPSGIALACIVVAVLPAVPVSRAVFFVAAILLCLLTFRYLAPPGLLGFRAGVPTLILLNTAVSASYSAVEAVLPLSLVTLHAVPMAWGGLVLAASSMSWTAGSWLQAKVIRRVPLRPILGVGAAAIAVGMAGTAFSAAMPAVPLAVVVACWAVAAFGMGLTTASIALTVLEDVAETDAGQAAAGLQLSNMLGGACGAGLAGWLVASVRQDVLAAGAVIDVAILVAVLGLLAVLLSARRLPGTRTN